MIYIYIYIIQLASYVASCILLLQQIFYCILSKEVSGYQYISWGVLVMSVREVDD